MASRTSFVPSFPHSSFNSSVPTSVPKVADRAEEVWNEFDKEEDSSKRLGTLIKLCENVATWPEWMALHQVNGKVGSVYVDDALETALISRVQNQIPNQPDEAELLALRRVCLKLPSGDTRDSLVQRLETAIVKHLEAMVLACREGGTDSPSVDEALDVMGDWQAMARPPSALLQAIERLRRDVRSPIPCFGLRVERCMHLHRNDPHQLASALLSLTQQSTNRKGTTFDQWCALSRVSKRIDSGLAEKLKVVFDAIAAGFSEAERTKALEAHLLARGASFPPDRRRPFQPDLPLI